MIRIIMHGCSGYMGRVVTEMAAKDPEVEIVSGVDVCNDGTLGYPVYKSLYDCKEADVIVDFSCAKAIDALLDYCEEKKIPVVLCTTHMPGYPFRFRQHNPLHQQ